MPPVRAENRESISVATASKLLSYIAYNYKEMGLSMGVIAIVKEKQELLEFVSALVLYQPLPTECWMLATDTILLATRTTTSGGERSIMQPSGMRLLEE